MWIVTETFISTGLKAVLTKSVNEAGPDMVPPHYWALEGIQNAIAHGMGLEGG